MNDKSASQTLATLNTRILDVIEQECMGLVEGSEEGQRLYNLRTSLTESIREKMGFESIKELDDLVGGLIILYGEEMFRHGLAIGLDPHAALSLPASGYNY